MSGALTAADSGAEKENLSMSHVSRRILMKGTMATAGLALAAPFVSRSGFAAGSSGAVNIFAWAGYISDEMLAAFEKDTGIKPVYTPYGTNDELLNQMRACNGSGYDVIWPAIDRVPNYVEFGLIQPIDEKKVLWDRVLASALKGSETLGAVIDGKRYQVPTDWGTEAITFDKNTSPLEYAPLPRRYLEAGNGRQGNRPWPFRPRRSRPLAGDAGQAAEADARQLQG